MPDPPGMMRQRTVPRVGLSSLRERVVTQVTHRRSVVRYSTVDGTLETSTRPPLLIPALSARMQWNGTGAGEPLTVALGTVELTLTGVWDRQTDVDALSGDSRQA